MRFWRWLTSGKVEPFVWVYYIALLWWGIYATAGLAPHGFVAHSLGSFYGPWCWAQIPATISVMIGLLFNLSGPHLPGLCMQVGGHSCMFFVLLGYEVVDSPQKDFTFFAIGPYVLGCFFLTLTTGRLAINTWRQRNDG